MIPRCVNAVKYVRLPSRGAVALSRSWLSSDARDVGDAEDALINATAGRLTGNPWAPESIERRVTRRRPRSNTEAVRTPPPKSEEDFWLEAGAPGYTSEELQTRSRLRTAATPAAKEKKDGEKRARTGGGQRVRLGSHDAFGTHSYAQGDMSAHAGTRSCVRMSTHAVSTANLPAMVRAYQLLMLPAYASADGFLGAQLLVDGVPLDVSLSYTRTHTHTHTHTRTGADAPGEPSTGSSAPSASPSHVWVIALSTWRDAACMRSASSSSAYVSAAERMAAFVMRGQGSSRPAAGQQADGEAGAAGAADAGLLPGTRELREVAAAYVDRGGEDDEGRHGGEHPQLGLR